MNDAPLSGTGSPAAWPSSWMERPAACLLCGSADLAPEIDGVRDWFFQCVPGDFAFSRCTNCQSLALVERPDAEHIGLAYAAYYTHAAGAGGSKGAGLARRLRQQFSDAYIRKRYRGSRSITDRLLSAVFERFPDRQLEIDVKYRFLPAAPAEVLDYGCGNGDFLRLARSCGHAVSGIDFDTAAVTAAKSQGIDVSTPDEVDEAAFHSRFDIVTAAHVIEHLADPAQLLASFRQWLKPGGMLFIEVPNAEADGLDLYGQFWRGLEAPRHFSIPSLEGLRTALYQAGFAPPKVWPRPSVAHWLWPQSRSAADEHGAVIAEGPGTGDPGRTEFLTLTAMAR